MSLTFRINPDVILFHWPKATLSNHTGAFAGGKPPQKFSDAARSWEGSAVLGVPPMSDCRGFPHERLHQDNVLTPSRILGCKTNYLPWNSGWLQRAPVGNRPIPECRKGVNSLGDSFRRAFNVLNTLFLLLRIIMIIVLIRDKVLRHG